MQSYFWSDWLFVNSLRKGKGQPLILNPPGYVDVEECEDEDDGAGDRVDNILERPGPGGRFWMGRAVLGLVLLSGLM